jgi:hypothetical protein
MLIWIVVVSLPACMLGFSGSHVTPFTFQIELIKYHD